MEADERRLIAYCTVPDCLEPAEGFVGMAYVKPRRWHLCAEHMRPVRAALWPLLHPRAAESIEAPAVAGGDDSTGFAT
jgi:hypothetical protein